jgi:hypothetical protein
MADPLPDDWRPPAQMALERAWAEHPKRELLERLQRERDAEGNKTWGVRMEDDEEDPMWVAVWLRPVDPRDPRPSIRVSRWPKEWEARQQADAEARADEHAD